jgi:predicted nucleic-acid-binding protein
VKVTADTNVLLRAVMQDDPAQGSVAAGLLTEAETVAIPSVVLCEFVWTLRRLYQRSPTDIARAIRALIAAPNVTVDRPAVAKGLELMDLGGDFADGIIAHDGAWLGGEEFTSFDRQAVRLLTQTGSTARLLP